MKVKVNNEWVDVPAYKVETGVPLDDVKAFIEHNATDVSIPEGVNTIGAYAWYRDANIVSLTIPSSVTSIGGDAFSYCTNLVDVTINANLSGTLYRTFLGCSKLTRLIVPNGPIMMQYTCMDCAQLTIMDIPQSVTSVSYGAVSGCKDLTALIVRNPKPPVATANAFNNSGVALGTANIYVPDASVDAYKGATVWSTWASQIKPLSEYQG